MLLTPLLGRNRAFKGLGQNLLWPFDGKWWFRVDAFPCEKMEDRDDIWKNLTSTSVLDEKHTKKTIYPYRRILLPPSTICLTLWGNFVEAKICLSGPFKTIDHMPTSKILSAKHPMRLDATSGCPQFTTTSTTATIKNRYHSYTEFCGKEISNFPSSS